MADAYQSTDRKSENAYPETPRLLKEGILQVAVADYQSVTGGYQITADGDGNYPATIDITELNDLGNRSKGFSPETLDVHIYKLSSVTGGGQVVDTFYRLPYVTFSNYSTGAVSELIRFYIQNTFVVADDLSTSFLWIEHFVDTQPTEIQEFSYKIYSTTFGFS